MSPINTVNNVPTRIINLGNHFLLNRMSLVLLNSTKLEIPRTIHVAMKMGKIIPGLFVII